MSQHLALVCSIVAILYPSSILSHGNMVKPYIWMDQDGQVGMAPKQMCTAGRQLPTAGSGKACLWFTNQTFIQGDPTLNISMSTYPDFYDVGGFFGRNPWYAVGTAHIHSPCGAAGGNPNGCPVGEGKEGDNCPGGGWAYGPLAQDFYPMMKGVLTTEWKKGSVAEVAWSLNANHGGGYSYRLCKLPEEGMSGITEECFQQGSLKFSGDIQWVQYGEDRDNRTEFRANRTTEGTFPVGSQWTKLPVPACHSLDGGFFANNVGCGVDGPNFTPPAPGLLGYGQIHSPDFQHYENTFDWSIVDEVVVPDVAPGEYVLSFRWDCEQTPQVWNTCSNINIVDPV